MGLWLCHFDNRLRAVRLACEMAPGITMPSGLRRGILAVDAWAALALGKGFIGCRILQEFQGPVRDCSLEGRPPVHMHVQI